MKSVSSRQNHFGMQTGRNLHKLWDKAVWLSELRYPKMLYIQIQNKELCHEHILQARVICILANIKYNYLLCQVTLITTMKACIFLYILPNFPSKLTFSNHKLKYEFYAYLSRKISCIEIRVNFKQIFLRLDYI